MMNSSAALIETIRIFGSYARGEQTEKSDFDVLIVLKKSQPINAALEEYVKEVFNREISVSWYSKDRLEVMFKMGHLFAWHLYKESRPLFVDSDWIASLGVPEEYTYGINDVISLMDIMKPIKKEIVACPSNIIYEAGLLFVCLRNIAIASLPSLQNIYYFGTDAPMRLDHPLNADIYNILKNARYASIRGNDPPIINIKDIINWHDMSMEWGKSQLNLLKNNTGFNGNNKKAISKTSRI
jgi:predicted nucleotidyltransferase